MKRERRILHSNSTRNPDVSSERESAYFINTRENLFVRTSILMFARIEAIASWKFGDVRKATLVRPIWEIRDRHHGQASGRKSRIG
ncbi:MAG: hypothetical protein F6J93_15370 [Oscillatoria sp. SIO1A7]|nr:hypothetical protein [Oscillatoria sp. SIO1A7]